jgi:formylglycine-generating enzyme required for sulfatase activity
MTPNYLKRPATTRLKPCAERMVETCDNAPADSCCGVIPCKLCLEWETYDDGIAYGSADFAGSSWTGTVGGHSFVSYWEREILPDIIPPVSSNSIGMPFALIEAGTYTMGSPGSETGRDADETEVSTSVDEFVIGTTEVTQSQYLTVRGLSPSHFNGSGRPVEKVSYADAQAFCTALSALPAEILMGRSYRLPTEAEWEFACRAGTTTAYNFGANSADLPDNGWFVTNSAAETHDVGGKPANAQGLVDAHGNVWEWAQNSRADGSAGDQVIRGGGWNSTAAECRSANRTLIAETTKRNDIGFRVVMVRSPIPQFGECEYVVTLDDEEVYRATCYEGASCRNPSGDVDVATAYLQGTLRWSKFDPRELALIVDPDTGCRDFFCGTCRCTCECLCVTLTEYGTGDVLIGEACDVAYDCDPPLWVGNVGYYSLQIALGRDQYGSCIITLTADGDEQEPVAAPGCGSMTASVTLPNGDLIEVRCKECACDEQAPSCPCCPGWPETASGSVDWTSIAAPSDCGASGPGENPTGDFSCPETGDETGVLIRSDATFLYVRVFCDADTGTWRAQYRSAISGGIFEPPVSLTWADATDFEFVCPDCADAVDGQATGTIDFTAKMACETSGGVVEYDVVVHGDVTIGCP